MDYLIFILSKYKIQLHGFSKVGLCLSFNLISLLLNERQKLRKRGRMEKGEKGRKKARKNKNKRTERPKEEF